MKRQQLLVITGGLLLLVSLLIFGKRIPEKTALPAASSTAKANNAFDIKAMIASEKEHLTTAQQAYLNSVESGVVRGDVKNQQIKVYHQLAAFWNDSIGRPEPYGYYTAEAAKLENSEKSLTFAAQLFLRNLRAVADPGLKGWMATEAKVLFEKALALNPANDSARIGLGSSYIFGSSAEDPQEVMQGIQQILQVAKKDSNNMYAQLMLGIGGVVSGQYDRAIDRLNKVLSFQPQNLEALLTLAEAYERTGAKADAVRCYESAKKMIKIPEVLKEIDERIQQLK